ncbi:uncharacterized protein N7482_000933 [Penicillium canariense]|uniref:Nephrocystin 3-like N-terminal domain-containing protein n=1 Tax=Penicillium canariense TaxID=189055 RepID=A0A9W9LSL4_9EURO|nr:uncharacterized protein N7482_000933 [Penicillium canariense]KAJ5175056.1 hypothetical protein N7482_000933 [Penicillium canariense]
MVNVSAVRESLVQVAQSTRVAMRCLNTGRDSHDASFRALSLLTDILDLLYRIKDEISWAEEKWFVAVGRLRALSELLSWFGMTMKSVELYFQPGGVSPFYFRKHLLDKTYNTRLEQYKIMFLLSMQPDSEERALLDKEIRDSLKMHREVDTANLKVGLQFEDDALNLTSRLSSEHYIALADLCNRRQQGSCSWIFDNSSFKQWLFGAVRTLYCIGPPGAGKTFLSSAIIDFLQKTFTSPDVATVFVFCQEDGGKERTSIDLLKNILAQLVYRKRSLSYATSALYHSESLRSGSASPKAYQNAIRAEVNRFSKVLFVIDGLDMFSEKERILGRLQKLPQQAQLLVTLREMSGVKPQDNSGYVSVLAPPEDIGLYTLTRARADSSLRKILGGDSPDLALEDKIIHAVVDKSHGVFLLSKIHLDLLSQYTDSSLLERALVHLPENLSEAYGEAMKQIVSLTPRATRYIYWALYSLRPLTVSELKSAVDEEDEEASKPEQMTFEHSLQIQTAGLLSVDAVSGSVRFVHRTAKEYLDGSAARVFFPGAQKEMAQACLTAISPDEIVDECYSNDVGPSRILKKGFLNYAATYWGLHAREVDEEEQTIQVLIKTFLNKLLWRRPPLDYTKGRADGMPSELGIGKYPNDWSGLHFLAFFGVPGKAKRLLEQGAKVNGQENALGVTPLHCAVYQGNDEMAEFLLMNGANGNATTADGQTALHIASQRGHRKCMKLLFSSHVDLHIFDHAGSSCLHSAVGTATDEATVPLLVKHKVDLNFQNPKNGNTALHLAVQCRRPRIILFLLEKGATIDIVNDEGLTPLQLAANTDNCEAISLLLQHCAHIEARSLAGPTALQYAAWKGHWIAFDLLLIGGADINVWNKQGETLLHEQARYSSNTSIMTKILDQGANIEARTSQGYTPLQCAAISGNKTMFHLLLDRGAKIEVETAKGETILHLTPPTNQDCLDILKTALDDGIDVKAISSQGWTPLHQTVYAGTGALDITSDRTVDYIQLLLAHGASINEYAVSGAFETPLHLAAMAPIPRPSLVDFLIRRGAKVNATTSEGKTALHLAAERGREPLFRTLLDAGADLSLEIPPDQKSTANGEKGEKKDNPTTAFELAKKNPFGSLWFDDDGQLRPVPQRSGRDSATTIFEDMDSDLSEPETGGSSTLVGSEQQYIVCEGS